MKFKMKIKNLVLSVFAFGGLLLGGIASNDSVEASQTKRENGIEVVKCEQLESKLQSNQTELFYMYSNESGYYFLDPKAEYENVIYVGHDDFLITKEQAHHGNKFIGTFEDDSLWELIGLEKMK